MLVNLLIKLLEQAGNILEGLFWLGVIIILFVFLGMLMLVAGVALLALFNA